MCCTFEETSTGIGSDRMCRVKDAHVSIDLPICIRRFFSPGMIWWVGFDISFCYFDRMMIRLFSLLGVSLPILGGYRWMDGWIVVSGYVSSLIIYTIILSIIIIIHHPPPPYFTYTTPPPPPPQSPNCLSTPDSQYPTNSPTHSSPPPPYP